MKSKLQQILSLVVASSIGCSTVVLSAAPKMFKETLAKATDYKAEIAVGGAAGALTSGVVAYTLKNNITGAFESWDTFKKRKIEELKASESAMTREELAELIKDNEESWKLEYGVCQTAVSAGTLTAGAVASYLASNPQYAGATLGLGAGGTLFWTFWEYPSDFFAKERKKERARIKKLHPEYDEVRIKGLAKREVARHWWGLNLWFWGKQLANLAVSTTFGFVVGYGTSQVLERVYAPGKIARDAKLADNELAPFGYDENNHSPVYYEKGFDFTKAALQRDDTKDAATQFLAEIGINPDSMPIEEQRARFNNATKATYFSLKRCHEVLSEDCNYADAFNNTKIGIKIKKLQISTVQIKDKSEAIDAILKQFPQEIQDGYQPSHHHSSFALPTIENIPGKIFMGASAGVSAVSTAAWWAIKNPVGAELVKMGFYKVFDSPIKDAEKLRRVSKKVRALKALWEKMKDDQNPNVYEYQMKFDEIFLFVDRPLRILMSRRDYLSEEQEDKVVNLTQEFYPLGEKIENFLRANGAIRDDAPEQQQIGKNIADELARVLAVTSQQKTLPQAPLITNENVGTSDEEGDEDSE